MKAIDMTGQRFGRLTVLEYDGTDGRRRRWRCQCDCGAPLLVLGESLRSGNTTSCGCFHRECLVDRSRTHGRAARGERRSTEYRVWAGVIQRCTNPSNTGWSRYGGRGIAVCERWRMSFEAFLEDVGLRPGPEFSIDRIDNERGYEPGNVRWATATQQTSNTRRNRYVDVNGERVTIAEAARRVGLKQRTLRRRLVDYGWDVQRALGERAK